MTTETNIKVRSSQIDAKKIFFDWSGVVAIALGAMAWGTAITRLNDHDAEIALLRAAAEAHNREAIIAAQNGVTKADFQRLDDEVTALQMRRGR